MSVDQEPLGLRWAGLSPALSLLMPTVSLPVVPPWLPPGLQHHWNAPLPILPIARENRTASVPDLCPKIIGAGSLD